MRFDLTAPELHPGTTVSVRDANGQTIGIVRGEIGRVRAWFAATRRVLYFADSVDALEWIEARHADAQRLAALEVA